MANRRIIIINKIFESSDNFVFKVTIRNNKSTTHIVTIDKPYFNNLQLYFSSPQELLEQSFTFLLKRESNESILKEFNLEQIKTYFPEYEKEIIKKQNN